MYIYIEEEMMNPCSRKLIYYNMRIYLYRDVERDREIHSRKEKMAKEVDRGRANTLGIY